MRRRDVERLYAEHGSRLLSFLVYRVGDPALAEDLLSETFELALRARQLSSRRRSAGKSWLYTTALNRVRDHMRRQAAETRALERAGATAPGTDAAHALQAIDDRDALGRALAALSVEEREALALRYGADLTVPELAKVTGEPLTTVEGRVYRGLRKLREDLA